MNRKPIKKAVKKELKMNRCKYCFATEDLTIDHKKPVIQGGTNDLKNLQCLCQRCNRMKSSLTDGQVKAMWRWFLEIEVERLTRGQRRYPKSFDKKLKHRKLSTP